MGFLLEAGLQRGDEGFALVLDFVFDLEDALALTALGLFEFEDLVLPRLFLLERGSLAGAALEIADLAFQVFELFLRGEFASAVRRSGGGSGDEGPGLEVPATPKSFSQVS